MSTPLLLPFPFVPFAETRFAMTAEPLPFDADDDLPPSRFRPREVLPPPLRPASPSTQTNIRTSVELVTPEIARAWLNHNIDNRRLRDKEVQELAADLRRGDFPVTSDGIGFDIYNRMINGQHRCYGIILADVPATLVVVRGLAPEAQGRIDVGTKRSVADALKIAGYEAKNGLVLGAACKLLLVWEQGLIHEPHKVIVTNGFIEDALRRKPTLEAMANRAAVIRGRVRLSPSVLAIGMLLTAEIDEAASTEFFDRLADGVNLDKGNAILALRNRMASAKLARTRLTQGEEMSALFRTWNHWRKGEQVDRLPLTTKAEGKLICPKPI